MKTLGKLPTNLTKTFAPPLVDENGPLSVSNLTATCNATTGVVTISWDDFESPHDLKSQSRGYYDTGFTQVGKSLVYRMSMMSSFDGNVGAPNYVILDTLKYSNSIMSLDIDDDSYFGNRSNAITNPYESNTGVAISSNVGHEADKTGVNYYNNNSYVVVFPESNDWTNEITVNVTDYNLNSANSDVWRYNGPMTSGNCRVWIGVHERVGVGKFLTNNSSVIYQGNLAYADFTLSGPSISSPVAPTSVTNFQISGRTITWDDSTTKAVYYIYVYKWNGSIWQVLRNGYLADNYTGAYGTGDQSYTIPVSDGSGYFYISVSTYGTYGFNFSSYVNSSQYTL